MEQVLLGLFIKQTCLDPGNWETSSPQARPRRFESEH